MPIPSPLGDVVKRANPFALFGSAGSRRPRIGDAKNVHEMVSDSMIGAPTQSAKEIWQLA